MKEMLTSAVNAINLDSNQVDEITAHYFANRLPPHTSKNAPIGRYSLIVISIVVSVLNYFYVPRAISLYIVLLNKPDNSNI